MFVTGKKLSSVPDEAGSPRGAVLRSTLGYEAGAVNVRGRLEMCDKD